MKSKRIILVNQVVGKLFYELSIDLAKKYSDGGILLSGEICERNLKKEKESKLFYENLYSYNRKTNLKRFYSWLRFACDITKYAFSLKKNDLILITSNPPISHFFLFLIIKLKKLPFIILVYDLYPNILVSTNYFGANNPLILIWKWLNKIIYSQANKVITLSNNMSRLISKEFDIDIDEVGVIPPWVDINFIKPLQKSQNKYSSRFIGDKEFVVLYSGNMGITHDIESIVKAADELKEFSNILFLLIGGGEKFSFVQNYIKKNNLKNIRLFEYQTEEILPYTLSLADISIVSIGEAAEDLILPSKTFYYLAAGSSLIVIGNKGNELTTIISKYKIGYSVAPKSHEKLAKTILKSYRDENSLMNMKKNSRNLAINKFSKEKGISVFFNFIKDL